MLDVSSELRNAWVKDDIRIKPRLIVEFGSNRFNDNQIVTASSTKVARRGLASPATGPWGHWRIGIKKQVDITPFWKAEDVFNDKPPTMKWLVCDAGARINQDEDGTGYRAIQLDEKDHPTNYEKGWWSAIVSGDNGDFEVPQWVESRFFDDNEDPFARRVNKVVLRTVPGYSNMKEVLVEYKNHEGDWIIIDEFELDPEEYEKEWVLDEDILVSGLRATIYSTQEPNTWARLSELNAYWIKDISDYVISADVDESKEDYDGPVPIGTTSANTLDVELDNTEGLFNVNNTDSIYAPYLGANCRALFDIGTLVNYGAIDEETELPEPPVYEYSPMGEYWTDEWDNDGGGATARFSSRDFSKFLQEDMTLWGRVWRNTDVTMPMRDILLMLGFPLERMHFNHWALPGVQIVYMEDDDQPWSLFGELALSSLATFGFKKDGDFYFESVDSITNDEPVYTLDWNTNILDGSTNTELYSTKVVVEVSDYDLTETGTRPLWSPTSPTILSWTNVGQAIGPEDTEIKVKRAKGQTTGNLTENGFPNKSGYLFIPKFGINFVGGQGRRYVMDGELIKYKSRTDDTFKDCIRGFLDTPKMSWGVDQYVGEARYWEMEWSNAPALNVKYPFVTAIDTLVKTPGEEEPQAHVAIFDQTPFKGKLVIGNIVDYFTWLAGTGQTWKDFQDKGSDSEISFATSVAGEVAVEKPGAEKVEEEEDISAENANWLRRYGKNEVEISNKWIQTRDHAQYIADTLMAEYKKPRRVVEMSTMTPPFLEVGDVVRVRNYPQLDIENVDFNVIGASYSFDGGLNVALKLREVR